MKTLRSFLSSRTASGEAGLRDPGPSMWFAEGGKMNIAAFGELPALDSRSRDPASPDTAGNDIVAH
jgi:hypothetical protein